MEKVLQALFYLFEFIGSDSDHIAKPLQDGRIVTLRKPRNPDAEQARIYAALGIDRKTIYTLQRREVTR